MVLRFNRVESRIPETSTVALLGELLSLDVFSTVFEKLSLSFHAFYGIRQRNGDMQTSGVPGVNGIPADAFRKDVQAGSSMLGFGFSCMRGVKKDKGRAAHDLRFQMRKLQFRLRDLGLTGGSEEVYEKPPIKPEKFPGKDINRWKLWVEQYKSVAKANGWTNQQAIAAIPGCSTSWAVEEFKTVPHKYFEKVPGESTSFFKILLEILKPKMQQCRGPRATRNEYKSIRQDENES